jgi:hypothetical protein
MGRRRARPALHRRSDRLTLMQDFTTADGVAVAASTTWQREG